MTQLRHLFLCLQAKRTRPESPLLRPVDSWWLDVKLGLRMLVNYPGLALVAGLGVTVAVAIAVGAFSVIYGSFLKPSLPFDEGHRIVSIEIWDSEANKPDRRTVHDYHVWRAELRSMEEIGAFRTITPNMITPGAQLESVRVASISASGFRVTRVQPLMGRYLAEEDERHGAPSVIVIGENVWRNRFGSDPGILGRTIQLGATPHTVVGVMPEGFAFPLNHRLWVPLRTGAAPSRPLTGPELMVFGRLAAGATLESTQAELTTITRRSAEEFPRIYSHLRPLVMPYAHPFVGLHGTNDVAGLHMMNGIVTTLLLVVCLNVAVLIYTRTAMRQSEISVRTALGASRSRIVTQLFIEALVLSGIAAVAGVVIAEFALREVATATLHITSELPFWLSFHVSAEAVLYAGALSVLAAAIVGIVPALNATKPGVQNSARVVGVGGSGMRLGRTWTILIVAQVGFAVALLPGAVVSAWENLQSEFADPGIAAKEFLIAQLQIDGDQDRDTAVTGTGESTRRYASRQSELMRRLQDDPRVTSVTFAMSVPGDEPSAFIEAESAAGRSPAGRPQAGTKPFESTSTTGGTSTHEVRFNRVDVNFFRALDIPMLAGRGFEPSDAAPAGVDAMRRHEGGSIVVNQSFAQRLFGGDALGRRIRYSGGSTGRGLDNRESGDWYEIVGIVRDFPAGVSPGMLDSQIKLYHAVEAGQAQPANIALRVRGGTASTFTRRLLEIAAGVDPDLQLRNISSLDEALRKEQWIRRLEAAVLAAISLAVLALSSAGIYALMSFTVSQRRKEIGIRIALGAGRTRIVASIFSRALGQLAVGVALGIAVAAMLENASGNNLMRGNAPVVLPAIGLFLMAMGFLATLGPSRRCLRIDPIETLREQ